MIHPDRPARAAAAEAAPGLEGARAEALPWLRWVAFLPSCVFVLIALAPPLNHDVAAVLSFSERWLQGEVLYRDLIDVNPPLIFVLSLLPAAIGAASPLAAVHAVPLCVLGLCWLSVRLTLRVLPSVGAVQTACLAAAIPLTTLAAGYDFAQREHLMVVAALPYLALTGRRVAGVAVPARLAIGIAVLAAAGFALKPHFLLIPAAIEALVLLRRGPLAALRDPAPWAMAAAWAVYCLAIQLVFPDYLGRVLPLVFAHYLGLHDFSWWQVILTDRMATGLALLVPMAVIAFRPGQDRAVAAPAQAVALAGLAAALVAILQEKGWSYHLLPVRLLGGLLAVMLLARWLDGALAPARARRDAAAVAALAALGLGILQMTGAEAPWRQITWSWSEEGQISALVQREAAGQSVLVLSPAIYPIFPAVNYAGARFTLPTMNIWPLQGAYATCAPGGARYRESAAMPEVERGFVREVTEGLVRRPPAAILVALDAGIPNCGRGFDLVEYLTRNTGFAAAFRHYRPKAELAGYRLYTRIR